MTSLKIENFKAFASLELGLAPLTLLTGMNSAGKSTVTQALLLFDLCRDAKASFAPLNGARGLALGEALDVLHARATESVIALELEAAGEFGRVELAVPEDRSLVLPIINRLGTLWEGNQSLVDTYLSAERLGPRDLLEVDSGQRDSRVGVQGEFAAHVLAAQGRRRVPEALLHPSTESANVGTTLEAQVGLWLSEIVSSTLVEATWIQHTNAAHVRFRKPEALTEWLRPANVGFGFSYVLPILVAALTATPERLFIVENPEAHLHPAGQSRMGRFLARLAGSGVDCVVESHSDHVLNGIRLGVAEEGVLAADAVAIHFFDDERHVDINLTPSGRLESWPAGFFDQGDQDLALLSRVRR